MHFEIKLSSHTTNNNKIILEVFKKDFENYSRKPKYDPYIYVKYKLNCLTHIIRTLYKVYFRFFKYPFTIFLYMKMVPQK